MAAYSGALSDFCYGLRHAAKRYLDFAESDGDPGNPNLYLILAQEREGDANEVEAIAVEANLAHAEPKLDPSAADLLLGFGSSDTRSPAIAAYRVLRAEGMLGRIAGQLASLDGPPSVTRKLTQIEHHIAARREALKIARRRALDTRPLYESVTASAQERVTGLGISESISPRMVYELDDEAIAYFRKQDEPRAGEVDIWYGTNRKAAGSGRFLAERASQISFGRCRVVVPIDRVMGSLGHVFWRRVFLGDNRVKLTKVHPLSERNFWANIANEITTGGDAERHALIFLHGYRTSFEDAARRTAQLKADLGHAGPAGFFSWPSLGKIASYTGDEAAMEGSELAIRNFLIGFAKRSGATAVHIIAHSMGNRGLARAFEAISLAAASATSVRFGQVFLAAPDVDAEYFRNVAAAYGQLSERTTLYVTNNDKAIGISRFIHSFDRVGLAPPIWVEPGIDTIDASHVNLDFPGHGYAAEIRPVLADINCLLQGDVSPDVRFGIRRAIGGIANHWEFVP
jgi:esterase/lipase superfamily enzyme